MDTWLAARAAYVLRSNSNAAGTATKASPSMYPHQWSWDAAFIAIGLATLDVPRACVELDSLLAGQWRNGMIPHIVLDPEAKGYFPGADWWRTKELAPDAPDGATTSGLCQPPVHAIAAARLLRRARAAGQSGERAALSWARSAYPKLSAWHDFLARDRMDPDSGLIQIFHGWESGTDNAPRWDEPYSNVVVGDLPHYVRRDTEVVDDRSQRPSDGDYDRYMWLVEEAKRCHYDQRCLRRTTSFRCGDVLFTAVFAAASDALAEIARTLGSANAPHIQSNAGADEEAHGDAGARHVQRAAAARAAVLRRRDSSTGLASDVDLLTGKALGTDTVAAFAPLISGGLRSAEREALVARLMGRKWAGHSELKFPLPPSTSPDAPAFQVHNYWRGPAWPVIDWLLSWALRRDGDVAAADALRQASLDQLAGGEFSEYYEPLSGAPLGSVAQSWTAAVALDWLVREPA